MNKLRTWLDKADPEGLTNRDFIQMTLASVIGIGGSISLLIWASLQKL